MKEIDRPNNEIIKNRNGQKIDGFNSPVTKGRLDVRGINASKSLSKYWLNALTPAEAKNVDIDIRKISGMVKLLFGTIKAPEIAHSIIVKLILTLKRSAINFKFFILINF